MTIPRARDLGGGKDLIAARIAQSGMLSTRERPKAPKRLSGIRAARYPPPRGTLVHVRELWSRPRHRRRCERPHQFKPNVEIGARLVPIAVMEWDEQDRGDVWVASLAWCEYAVRQGEMPEGPGFWRQVQQG
jgi:hypothetical protein